MEFAGKWMELEVLMIGKSWVQVSVVFHLKSKYGFKKSLRLGGGEKETSRSGIRTPRVACLDPSKAHSAHV